MTNLKIKSALAAVTLAAATFAAPLSAQASDYDRKCGDTGNAVLGAIVGGTAGAAIGDGIAGRGQSTEVGILGAIIGGIAGAAVGDSASDCENNTRNTNTRGYTTTTSYPAQTTSYPAQTTSYPAQTTTYPARTTSYPAQTTTYPVRTTTYPVQTTTYPATTQTTVYRTASHTGHGNSRNTNRVYTQGASLYQIDRQIDSLRKERAYLKAEQKRSRKYRRGIESRLGQIAYRLDTLKRERKQVKKYSNNSRNDYRPQTQRGHYHGTSRNACYGDH